MSDQLRKNIDLLMTEGRLNAEELSRRTGLPASTIKKIRNHVDSNPTLSTLSPLSQYFSLTISQLVGDEPFPKTRMSGAYQLDTNKLFHIPLINWQTAIHWLGAIDHSHPTITTEHKYSKQAYALLVEEENWENLAKDTALLVEPTLDAEHRDFVIVHKVGQKTPTLKQILIDDEQIYLKPVTQGYNIAIFTPEYKILGVIVEYKKHLRKTNIL